MIPLPTAYFPSIFQAALILQATETLTEAKEHFVKQSFRNRCEIYGANGKLALSIPLKKWKNHTPVQDIQISFDDNWQSLHWRSIESAYRTSPFFEFYEDDIKPLFFDTTPLLLERNTILTKEMLSLININYEVKYTKEYTSSKPDFRQLIQPKNKAIRSSVDFPIYIQVFQDKHGFIPNLSILDLVFNLGPESKTYLNQLTIPI